MVGRSIISLDELGQRYVQCFIRMHPITLEKSHWFLNVTLIIILQSVSSDKSHATFSSNSTVIIAREWLLFCLNIFSIAVKWYMGAVKNVVFQMLASLSCILNRHLPNCVFWCCHVFICSGTCKVVIILGYILYWHFLIIRACEVHHQFLFSLLSLISIFIFYLL